MCSYKKEHFSISCSLQKVEITVLEYFYSKEEYHANLESVLAEAWLQAFKFLLCF